MDEILSESRRGWVTRINQVEVNRGQLGHE
jgi:hypothetical protein